MSKTVNRWARTAVDLAQSVAETHLRLAGIAEKQVGASFEATRAIVEAARDASRKVGQTWLDANEPAAK